MKAYYDGTHGRTCCNPSSGTEAQPEEPFRDPSDTWKMVVRAADMEIAKIRSAHCDREERETIKEKRIVEERKKIGQG